MTPSNPANLRVASRWLARVAEATPLPASFPKTEIGLMTRDEFLAFQNPEGKHHETGAYDFDLAYLNRTTLHQFWEQGAWSVSNSDANLSQYLYKRNGVPAAVLAEGMLYYADPSILRDLPQVEIGLMGNWKTLDIQQKKRVKYLLPQVAKLQAVTKRNLSKYKYVLQHVKIRKERYEIRAETPPVENKGATIVALNELGEIVATAQDEWGATLIAVAREYRGRGVGPVLAKYWHELNPKYLSGGYTYAGEVQALKGWAGRVREFLARGWYVALVKQKRLTTERVKAILAGIGERVPKVERAPAPEALKPKQVLVFADSPTFVVYDEAFLTEQDDRFIYGYGFFRDEDHVGTFLYNIDYDPSYKDLVTRVALQMSRDDGDTIYVGPGYGDMLEWEGVAPPGVVEQDGNYIKLTRDILPLRSLASKERSLRRKQDPYEEKYALLLELAEAKWKP